MVKNKKQNNNIGTAIQYFRETHQISQSKLCKGLCSVATLSRIEAGERDADSLLLETLLERLGKTPNQFELILSDSDYTAYQTREDIKKYIEDKNFDVAHNLIIKYAKLTDAKISVHNQFVIYSKALLNELQGGAVDTTLELLMEAIGCTVPDFKTNAILDYYLSNFELNIIIDIILRKVSAGKKKRAKEILHQVLDYLDLHSSLKESYSLYPKVAIIAARIYIQEQDWARALEICNLGIDKNKGNRKMDYLGELYLMKAQSMEALNKNHDDWIMLQKECLKLYLQAYYVFDFCEEHTYADNIMKHLQEEYQWADTD